MSVRIKFAAVSMFLFVLMVLMFNGSSVTSPSSGSSPAQWSGVLMLIVAVVLIILGIEVLLTWRDPFVRFKYQGKPLYYYIIWALSGIGMLVVATYFRKAVESGRVMMNSTSNNTSVNGSVVPPSPVYYNNTTQIAPTGEPLPSQYLLYLLLLLALAAFGYTTVMIYRDALRRRRRKKIKMRAEFFDRKLEELGLDMFNDPREAIVGIYKNAVLWLEYLGIPYRESWTHWEHAERVKYMHDAFVELTRLFEKAKYAPEKLTWGDAEKALEVYRKMRRGINEIQ